MHSQNILVTGGAGFIGSHFVHRIVPQFNKVVVLDALTYAGNLDRLEPHIANKKIFFETGNILEEGRVRNLLREHDIGCVVNLAAETHVDRSIEDPTVFLQSNTEGVVNLLKACSDHFRSLSASRQLQFRFVQVSTDEVFGSTSDDLAEYGPHSPYNPSNPYSASKAGADMFLKAWFRTYGFPGIITYCTNNYGPSQSTEKFLPMIISNALRGQPITLYGTGDQRRNWIYVEDHCRGLELALTKGTPGSSYCFSGENEVKNSELIRSALETLSRLHPGPNPETYHHLVQHVPDRQGHDNRYALDDKHSRSTLGFSPKVALQEGLERTIQYYLSLHHVSKEV